MTKRLYRCNEVKDVEIKMIIDYLGGTNKIPRVLVTKRHHDIQVKKRITDSENM